MNLKQRYLVHDLVSLDAQRCSWGKNIEGQSRHVHSSRWAGFVSNVMPPKNAEYGVG
jgi:hypothetical protein